MKTCSKCGGSKPLSGFYPDKTKGDGASSHCRACTKARIRERYRIDPEAVKAANRASRERNSHKWSNWGRELRKRVLAEYGGACKCCSESTPEFLGIDHVANNGESHRRELGSYGRSIYRWLEMNGFPKEGFQLLCHNCNMAKGLYGGCPHQGPPPGTRQATTRWTKARTPAVGDVAA
jgi:hypothetical protein